jgi:hypothetical protein
MHSQSKQDKLPTELPFLSFSKEYIIRLIVLIGIALANIVLLALFLLSSSLLDFIYTLSLLTQSGSVLILVGATLILFFSLYQYVVNRRYFPDFDYKHFFFAFAIVATGVFFIVSDFIYPWIQGHPAILIVVISLIGLLLLFYIYYKLFDRGLSQVNSYMKIRREIEKEIKTNQEEKEKERKKNRHSQQETEMALFFLERIDKHYNFEEDDEDLKELEKKIIFNFLTDIIEEEPIRTREIISKKNNKFSKDSLVRLIRELYNL